MAARRSGGRRSRPPRAGTSSRGPTRAASPSARCQTGSSQVDRAALARRHVVRGIERVGRRGAERAGLAAADARAERVAAVLDQHEAVLAAQRLDARPVERVAERVREHEAARARPDRGGDRLERRVVGVGLDVDVDRHEAVLVDGRDRRREADRGADDLVARLPAAARAGATWRRATASRLAWEPDPTRTACARSAAAAKPGAERGGEAALGEVGVEHRLGGRDEVLGAEHLRGDRDARRAGRERLRRQRRLGVAADRVERRPRAAPRDPPAAMRRSSLQGRRAAPPMGYGAASCPTRSSSCCTTPPPSWARCCARSTRTPAERPQVIAVDSGSRDDGAGGRRGLGRRGRRARRQPRLRRGLQRRRGAGGARRHRAAQPRLRAARRRAWTTLAARVRARPGALHAPRLLDPDGTRAALGAPAARGRSARSRSPRCTRRCCRGRCATGSSRTGPSARAPSAGRSGRAWRRRPPCCGGSGRSTPRSISSPRTWSCACGRAPRGGRRCCTPTCGSGTPAGTRRCGRASRSTCSRGGGGRSSAPRAAARAQRLDDLAQAVTFASRAAAHAALGGDARRPGAPARGARAGAARRRRRLPPARARRHVRPALLIPQTGALGGAERVLLDWSRALARPVVLACPPGRLADAAAAAGHVVEALPARPLQRRGRSGRAALDLAGLARDVARLAAAHRPGVVVASGAAARCSRPPRRRPGRAARHRAPRPRPRAPAAAATPPSRRPARSRRGSPGPRAPAGCRAAGGRRRVEVIRPGVDAAHWATVPAPPRHGPPRALWLGALAPWKRPDLALEIAALDARAAARPRRCAAARATPSPPGCASARRRRTSRAGSRLLGAVADPRDALAGAHVLLHMRRPRAVRARAARGAGGGPPGRRPGRGRAAGDRHGALRAALRARRRDGGRRGAARGARRPRARPPPRARAPRASTRTSRRRASPPPSRPWPRPEVSPTPGRPATPSPGPPGTSTARAGAPGLAWSHALPTPLPPPPPRRGRRGRPGRLHDRRRRPAHDADARRRRVHAHRQHRFRRRAAARRRAPARAGPRRREGHRRRPHRGARRHAAPVVRPRRLRRQRPDRRGDRAAADGRSRPSARATSTSTASTPARSQVRSDGSADLSLAGTAGAARARPGRLRRRRSERPDGARRRASRSAARATSTCGPASGSTCDVDGSGDVRYHGDPAAHAARRRVRRPEPRGLRRTQPAGIPGRRRCFVRRAGGVT